MSIHNLTFDEPRYYKITTDLDCTVSVTAVGGGGGGGSTYAFNIGGGSGGSGQNGNKVVVTKLPLSKDEALYIFPGEGGKGANSTSGGLGGKSLIGFNGGNGGISKSSTTGGHGGGGGGATCVWKSSKTNPLPNLEAGFFEVSNNTLFTKGIIAGGGGGGGGSGRDSGAFLNNLFVPTNLHTGPELATIDHRSFNDFMNTYAVCLRDKFYLVGEFSFHRKINIPSTQTYRVTFSADNYASIYLDYLPLVGGGANYSFTQTPNYVDVTIPAGNHVLSAVYYNYADGNAENPGAVAITIADLSGNLVWTTRSNLNNEYIDQTNFPRSIGGSGQSNLQMGGGGGGGGGGSWAGAGGVQSNISFNFGSYNGSHGTSFVSSQYPEFTLFDKTGHSGYGIGGVTASPGTNGYAEIISDSILNIYVREGNAWKRVNEIKRKTVSGWEDITEVYHKSPSTWQKVFSTFQQQLSQESITPGSQDHTRYSYLYLSNPPIWEQLAQTQLSIVLQQVSQPSFPNTDILGPGFPIEGGGSSLTTETTTFDDGSTLSITTDPSTGTVVSVTSTSSSDGGGPGGKVICTELYNQGLLDENVYKLDQQFGSWLLENHPVTYWGYRAWADILVRYMKGQGRPLISGLAFWLNREEKQILSQKISLKVAKFIAEPFANELARRMDKDTHRPFKITGWLVVELGLPICKLIGYFTKKPKRSQDK